MACLALDIGSSTIKGAVLDVPRRELAHIIAQPFPAPQAGLPSRWFEVDPGEIENAARRVIDALLEFAPAADALYVAGQMGGLVLVDPHGAPRSNYLSWRDQRTLADASPGNTWLAQIRAQLGDEVFHSLGRELQGGSTLALWHWLHEQGHYPADATPVTVADFVIGRLAHAPPQMHVTHAIGLLNLRKLDWHGEALARLGLGHCRLPRLVRGIEPAGECAAGSRTLRVYGAYGDQQCALYGAGLGRDELSINISTGSQVSRRTDRLLPGPFQTRAYLDGALLQTITHLPAGRSLNVLVDLLSELARAEGRELADPWRTIAALVDATPDEAEAESLSVDLQFFAGPLGTQGSIQGITTENLTVGRLFRAAFRSMAQNYARCALMLDPARSWQRILLSGSLARTASPLRDSISTCFGVPLRDAGDEETLLGLLKLAAEGARAAEPPPCPHDMGASHAT